MTKPSLTRGLAALAAVVLLCAGTTAADAAVEVLAAQYRADVPHPESDALWASMSAGALDPVLHPDRQFPHPALGGSVHVYLRNGGPTPVAVEDVLLDGISLKQAIAYSDQRKFKKQVYAASLYFSSLPKEQSATLVSLGEPIWWRAQPAQAAPGQAMEVTVRLRRDFPESGARLTLRLEGGGQVDVAVPGTNATARITDIAFSEDLASVWLYVRRDGNEGAVGKVLLDGQDVTSSCSIGRDAHLQTTPVVFRPTRKLEHARLYSFQAVFQDGTMAAAARRAFPQDMRYGVWGARSGPATDIQTGRSFVHEMASLNLNLHMVSVGSAAVQEYFKSDEGRKALADADIRRVIETPGKQGTTNPYAFYLADEPDTGDYRVQGVPAGKQVGCLAQGLAERARDLRAQDPGTPSMLNLDLTFTPHNWYVYGQVPDIFAADPYYQPRLRQAYEAGPGRLPLYSKAGFVYAESRICKLACEPNPLHIILYANSYEGDDGRFRGPTPEEKRIELYYALAAGAKGFSYWWYVPGRPARGLGADDEATRKLRREVGLMAAEMRTAGPLITRSAPVDALITHAPRLWVRALACGLDSMLLVVVNDDYVNDRQGTVIRPVEKSSVTLDLPSWLKSPQAFEISADGVKDVAASVQDGVMKLDLGTVEVTRLIVVTSDPALRDANAARYASNFAANIRKLRTAQ